ncbi:DUF1642 domain-containing protein [Streptococcus hyointestinalis]|nr:DUF1642 domain-containing protein [Streptococcus hyointestinalis]MCI6871591.1 DUF1642 domain-containing protein [Streptococcus hyointestinalis]
MFKMPKGKYDDKTKLVDGLRIVAQRFETDENEMYYILSDGSEVYEKTVSLLLEKPKVKLPKSVAEYLEKCKGEGLKLGLAVIEDCPFDVFKYLLNNMETFVRAWLDGYDIEKEKLYTAKLKLTDEYLAYDNDNVEYYFTDEEMASKFTEEEFKKMKFWDNPAFKVEEAH